MIARAFEMQPDDREEIRIVIDHQHARTFGRHEEMLPHVETPAHAGLTPVFRLARYDGAVSDDYYALLGVDLHADDDDIRRAWRKLALEHHPDRAGETATERFQLLSVAYSVISDPVARRAYDKRRGIPKKPAAPPPPPPAPVEERAPPVVRKAPGILITRLSRNLDILRAMGRANIAADGIIELFLEEEEWTEGGMVAVAMRTDVHCPACRGSTNIPCHECKDARVVEEQYSAWLAIRPGVEDGTILTPSAQLPDVVTPVKFRARRA